MSWLFLQDRIKILKMLACSGPRITGDHSSDRGSSPAAPTATYLHASAPPGQHGEASRQRYNLEGSSHNEK